MDASDFNDSSFNEMSTSGGVSGKPSPVLNDRALTSTMTAAHLAYDVSGYSLPKDADLNDVVSTLLKKQKDDSSIGRDVRRRQRKNKDQLKILENEYLKNPDWDRDFILRISDKLGLRVCQVYKWHWDQQKKEGLEQGTYHS